MRRVVKPEKDLKESGCIIIKCTVQNFCIIKKIAGIGRRVVLYKYIPGDSCTDYFQKEKEKCTSGGNPGKAKKSRFMNDKNK